MGAWFTSSFSNGSGSCVEVRLHGEHVSVRDTKFRRDPAHDPDRQPTITVPVGDWMDFLAGRPSSLSAIPDGAGVVLSAAGQAVELRYTPAEWSAFVAGVRLGEFAPRPSAGVIGGGGHHVPSTAPDVRWR